MTWSTDLTARCTLLILLMVCPPRRTTIRKKNCRSTVFIAFLAEWHLFFAEREVLVYRGFRQEDLGAA